MTDDEDWVEGPSADDIARAGKAYRLINPHAYIELEDGVMTARVPEGKEACDFCLSREGPMTTIECRPFTLYAYGAAVVSYDPWWAACPVCLILVKAGARERLVKKSAIGLAKQLGINVLEVKTDDIKMIQDGFWENFVRIVK